MIIATSDVHLGYSCSDENLFSEFLDEVVDKEEVKHLVLAGDILDMWRRENAELLLGSGDILSKLKDLHNNKKQVHYVVGNHDYRVMQLKDKFEKQYTIDVSMDKTLKCGDQEYYFIHGYQFEFPDDTLNLYEDFANILCLSDDTIGENADNVWSLYTGVSSRWEEAEGKIKGLKKAFNPPEKRLDEEDIGKLKETIKEWRTKNKNQIDDKFVIYGHTHRPYVCKPKKEANTGSWVDDSEHPVYNTYLTIEEDGTITLNEYHP